MVLPPPINPQFMLINFVTLRVLFLCAFCLCVTTASAQAPTTVDQEDFDRANVALSINDHFFRLLSSPDPLEYSLSLETIRQNWQPSFIPMALEVLLFARPGGISDHLIDLIKQSTGQSKAKSESIQDLFYWAWNTEYEAHPDYANFKADLYQNIDPLFATYFRDRQDTARIRLDEIRWGGVVQDGIPPLRNPKMLHATDASYLADDNIIFGIEINGDARAYPKRILAWHEMFTDTIGGVAIAGVYCTLCGTVIPYLTEVKGKNYQLGTSGFLYRSNKLMYDQATQSLWSTTEGKPILGPLVDQGIELEFASVVTTTWGEWRRRHPDTTVLSLKTGHSRDYDEGVSYADYFGTDEIMFGTPFKDNRLKNKQEVLALRFPAAPNQQVAIDTDFLYENRVFHGQVGQQKFVVFTDDTGANRVYDPADLRFTSYDGDQRVTDSQGQIWLLSESQLRSPLGETLERLPYRRAFWFGWLAAFPETKLIK